ncbi:apolipoprotein N-acyltransferase [Lichenihabitans psoromatis]|uniref:apolipoprotein N-acyltransferase n=1 Tax=Lichenihabitans psoromatis TaxID=2528642 RepID=UPI001036D41D|nr:apolipoprotein N-acyltransferase [Lichenihabitans psoromatis]
MIQRIAQRVARSTGWSRRFLALLAGATGALAMAPVDFVPALIIPMVVAVWLLDGSVPTGVAATSRVSLTRSVLKAAETGWWWGFGYFVAGLWWLGSAFLVEPDKFAWLLPLGVLGLPAYLALYTAVGFALAQLFWSTGPARLFTLACCLLVAEWLRGTLLTGFPWNEFGMALGDNLVLAQVASLIGVHGLTLLAVVTAAAPASIGDAGPGTRRFGPSALALLFVAAIAIYGALRLAGPGDGSVAGVHLRVVQPNAAIDSDFSYAHKDAILQHYLTLSQRVTPGQPDGLAGVTHVIWPESPFPFLLSRDPAALVTIGDVLSDKTVLITGAARAEPGPPDGAGGKTALYFNAVQVVDGTGTVLDSYDKVHLVPFGEFLPLQSILNAIGIQHFVSIPGGFQAGTDRRLLTVPGLPPVAPIICYEAIFSGDVVPPAAAGVSRPGLLLNVTNDSWFGFTAGPYQHFAQARLRAIEEGLPLIRSASTGISAIVDAHGRILASLPLGAEDVIDGALPTALSSTLFARVGNIAPLILLLGFAVSAALLGWLTRRKPARHCPL